VPQLLELIGQLLIRGYNVGVMLPSLIGQYRIVRRIGAGGMGLVYLGELMGKMVEGGTGVPL